ncbi:MAG: acyl-CoA thioesterase [Alistipes sp.]|jgi:acyl-CoA thioester hydrolase|nr:acyl-CoA thioesterase [Alistipes sp.]
MKVIETPIQTRFSDIDMFRHVNNVRQTEYLDLGKMDYYRRVVGLDSLAASPTLVIVSTRHDFVDQLRYEDRVVVRTWVDRVGTKSITLRQQIVALRPNTGAADVAVASVASGASNAEGDGNSKGSGLREVVCTEGEAVLAVFDLTSQQSLEVPAEWRDRIMKK